MPEHVFQFPVWRRDGQVFVVTVDAADELHVHPVSSWCIKITPRVKYAYRRNRQTRRIEYLHRLLLGAQRGQEIDHIDCDGLNNRRSNLRFCSRSENMGNVRGHKDGKTGVKGASWDPARKAYRAQIQRGGVKHVLGFFSSPEEAGDVYAKAAAALFGQFARYSKTGDDNG